MNQPFLEQWARLEQLAKNSELRDLKNLFKNNDNRTENLSYEVADIFIDFSKNWINQEVLVELMQLAKKAKLDNKIKALFSGEKVNTSENQAAMHTALRKNQSTEEIIQDRNTLFNVANQYRTGNWKTGFSKKVKTIVNIGIGGSYLGPKLAVQALTTLQTNSVIKVLFFPSVDDAAFELLIQSIDLQSTLFCISSKSMGTIETSKNTATIIKLLQDHANYQPNGNNQSLVAATTNSEKATELNIPQSHVMPFHPATGGRFSVWSSIGFPVLMAIGEQQFKEFLSGAETIDNHFENTQAENNIPVLMALISIWYRNFLDLPAYAVIPYDARLMNLPAWLQQLMMESNGKMHDHSGKPLDFSTSPWIFGDHGQLSQHAFFQAFHQGKDCIPIDFIGVLDQQSKNQEFLLINMLAQSAALMNGNDNGNKNCFCPGNRPSTTLLMKQLNAHAMGQLLALYEHMVFVQSVIWNINCFDQPGVELGKKIALTIIEHLQENTIDQLNMDQSTQQLLSKVRIKQ